jgi:hypothetical protein
MRYCLPILFCLFNCVSNSPYYDMARSMCSATTTDCPGARDPFFARDPSVAKCVDGCASVLTKDLERDCARFADKYPVPAWCVR